MIYKVNLRKIWKLIGEIKSKCDQVYHKFKFCKEAKLIVHPSERVSLFHCTSSHIVCAIITTYGKLYTETFAWILDLFEITAEISNMFVCVGQTIR